MPATFYISGLEQLEKSLQEIPEQLKGKIEGVIAEAVTDINREQIALAPTYNQTLKQHTGFVKSGELQWTLFSQMPYSAYMEFGTRGNFQPIPGVDASEYKGTATGSNKSMFQAILKWVQDKNIAGTWKNGRKSKSRDALKMEEQTAWAIMRSILIHGVKPHPFFFGPFLSRRERLIKDIQRAINK